MKRLVTFILLLVAFVYFVACTHDPLLDIDSQLIKSLNENAIDGTYEHYIMPESNDYANLPNQDVKNPITDAKVQLGKLLFFETGIGLQPHFPISKQTYSCATCHIPSRGFTAGRFQGIADGALGFGDHGEGRNINPQYTGADVDAQGARPLAVINTTYITNALWSGAFGSYNVNAGTESVWHQDSLVEINFQGLQGLEANNARALTVHRQVINKDVTDSLGYTAMFDEAFPDFPESERYTRMTGSFAIAAYFRTILTNQAPFQKWLKGDLTAMNEQQKEGAVLFFGKAGCVRCHNSPSLNSMPHTFFSVGVKNECETANKVFRTDRTDKRNLGRGGFTGVRDDIHKFKVPQLYNLKNFGFYFHGASKNSIREVVEYFNAGVPENKDISPTELSPLFRPLHLTTKEVDNLIEFLDNGLFDPDLERYAPTSVVSGNCIPNNDLQSQVDLGCH